MKKLLILLGALIALGVVGVIVVNQVQRNKTIRIEQTGEDGFTWYKLQKGSYQGVEDVYGKTIISLDKECDWVWYESSYGVFHADKGDWKGLYSKTGEEIISPYRAYNMIYVYSDYIGVEKEGKYGACDLAGKEIVEPICKGQVLFRNGRLFYEDANGQEQYISGVTLGTSSESVPRSDNDSDCDDDVSPCPDGNIDPASISVIASSSDYNDTSASSSNSRYGTLLKGGTFTFTGVQRSMNVSGATGEPFLVTINVYTDYLVDDLGRANPFIGSQQFEGVNCRYYKCNDQLYYLYGDDQTVRRLEYTNIMGVTVNTVDYYKPGDVRRAYTTKITPPNLGGSSSRSTTSTSKKNCKVCHGTGICQNCLGRGAVINHYTGEWSYCTYCNNADGTSIYTGKCYACKGQ